MRYDSLPSLHSSLNPYNPFSIFHSIPFSFPLSFFWLTFSLSSIYRRGLFCLSCLFSFFILLTLFTRSLFPLSLHPSLNLSSPLSSLSLISSPFRLFSSFFLPVFSATFPFSSLFLFLHFSPLYISYSLDYLFPLSSSLSFFLFNPLFFPLSLLFSSTVSPYPDNFDRIHSPVYLIEWSSRQ